MTRSQAYDSLEQKIDLLQKQIKSGVRDQLVNMIALESTQEKLKALQEKIVKDGDVEMSDDELTELM